MIALFQHGIGEPPGYILQLMRERDLEYKIIPLFETGEVPGIKATHMVFLGGQMSVNDEKEYPWLLQEKELIRQAIRSGTPVPACLDSFRSCPDHQHRGGEHGLGRHRRCGP
jgi:GMP synthase-like glutamine amidotransferase